MNEAFYPAAVHTDLLRSELKDLEGAALGWARDIPRFLRHFSSVIRFAARSGVVPGYVLRDWIWIGSQMRIFASEEIAVLKASGCLILFIFQRFESLRSGEETVQNDVAWATTHTVSVLLEEIGVESLRTFVSRDERKLAEDRWLKIYESGGVGISDIAHDIEAYLQVFEEVASECYLPDVGGRIRELTAVARKPDDNSKWAAAALRYLVTSKDVVPDNLGYFGLVDDIFVINQAYSMCCRQSPWLFLLDNFVREWPDLARLVIGDEADFSPLPQYTQVVVGVILYSLKHGPKNTCVVIPQSGDVAPASAFFAAIMAARENAIANPVPANVHLGSDVVLTSARRTILARYHGTADIADQTFHMIELSKGVRQSLTPELLDAMRVSPSPHKNLSSFKEFKKWRDEFSPIALEQLLSAKLSLDNLLPKVLLVTQRNRLEHWLKTFRPMGKRVSEVIGVRYFMRSGQWHDLPGAITSKPLLLACNDTFTAAELLRSKEGRKACEHLNWVIVDGAGVSGDIGELVSALNESAGCQAVFLSALNDFELCKELSDYGSAQLYVAPDDVGIVGPRVRSASGSGPLSCHMAQIRCQTTKKTRIVDIADDRIQTLYDLTMLMRSAANELDNSTFDILIYSMSKLLRRVARQFYPPEESEAGHLSALIDSTVGLANLTRAYHSGIPRIVEALEDFGTGNEVGQKKRTEIAALRCESGSQRTALVCSSKSQKAKLCGSSRDLFGVEDSELVTLEDLRRAWPYDSLIIPAWFDKKQMRELRASGFADNYSMVLYPFERSWEEVSARAQRRWSSHLLSATSDYASRFERTYKEFSSAGRWPMPKSDSVREEVLDQEEGVLDNTGQHLVSAISKVQKEAGGKLESVVARMVLFDDPEYFAFLAPGGRTICIPEDMWGPSRADNSEATDAGAEFLLNRPVRLLRRGNVLAFPIDHPGDVLDSLADEMLENSPGLRRTAGLWRSALRNYANQYNLDAARLKEKLAEVGVPRHIATIRNWLFTATTIAPRSWRRVVPRIGRLTSSPALTDNFNEVAQAIERIYQARREAADILLDQLRTGRIDVELGILKANVKQIEVQYRILRIARIDRQVEVPADLVGKLHNISGIDTLIHTSTS